MSNPLPNTEEGERRGMFIRMLMEIQSSPYEIIDGEKVYDVLNIVVKGKVSETQIKALVESERVWFEPFVNKICKEEK